MLSYTILYIIRMCIGTTAGAVVSRDDKTGSNNRLPFCENVKKTIVYAEMIRRDRVGVGGWKDGG